MFGALLANCSARWRGSIAQSGCLPYGSLLTDRRRKVHWPIRHLGWEYKMSLLWFLIVGVISGWLAGTLVKGGGFGLVGDLVVGVVGALVGGFLFSTFGVSAGGGLVGSIIVATIGAVVLLYVVRLIKRA